MARKCSHCGYMGHNSRTCNLNMTRGIIEGGGGLKLFGVQMISNDHVPSPSSSSIAMIKKRFSLDCLSSPSSTTPCSCSSNSSTSTTITTTTTTASPKLPTSGYLSDGLIGGPNNERKKGVPWSEEEHREFLIRLEKLGKGDWRGISRNFVTTRTPTQVASHAQKYFLRQNSLRRNNRGPSLFDANGDGKFLIQTEAPMSLSNGISQRRRYGSSSICFNFPRGKGGETCKTIQSSEAVWLQSSFCSTPCLTKSSVYKSAPDLELTLASSSINKSSGTTTNQLLLGPIGVI